MQPQRSLTCHRGPALADGGPSRRGSGFHPGLVDFVEPDSEVLPGLRIETTGGHTPYHQMVLISDGNNTVSYPADLLPTEYHLNPAWLTAIDIRPLESVDRKMEIFARAVDENWLVVLNHDIRKATGRIVRDDAGRLEWSPE